MPLGRNSRFIDKDYLAQQLRNLRMQNKLSMAEIAVRVGVAASTYSNYENKKTANPSENFITKLLMAFPDKTREFFVKDKRLNANGVESGLPIEVRDWMNTKQAEPFIIQAYADYYKSKMKL